MILLEPLLGTDLDYPALLVGVNNYCQRKRYKHGGEHVTENVRRFLDIVREEWKRNKKKRKFEEEKPVGWWK